MSRKSGRIKSSKKKSDDFVYDQTKYDAIGDEIVGLSSTQLDVSSNISELLTSHCQESNDRTLNSFHSAEDEPLTLQSSGVPFIACPLCDKHLNTDEEIELHMIEHRAENEKGAVERLTCDICGKVMADLFKFKRHMRAHLGHRPFQCGQCDKTFIDSTNLKRHMKCHEDDRPYSCDICQKTFRDTAGVSRHMLTHTERPRIFQCSLCDKNFADNSGLKRHQRTHTGIRPFTCEICHKSFLDSGSFKRHQKIHTGIKNHHCPVCGKGFMEKQSLIRHQKTVCKPSDKNPSQSGNENGTNSVANSSGVKQNEDTKGDGSSVDEGSFMRSGTKNGITGVGFDNDSMNLDNVVQENSLGSPLKGNQSLSSLIQKDPGLYDSINELVDGIDSYEKMLDLCGDRGQKEIDDALKFKPLNDESEKSMALLCFECGENLVDGVNFKSGGKVFNDSMTNAFKCFDCEEENLFETPSLMADYDDLDTERALPFMSDAVDNGKTDLHTDETIGEFGNVSNDSFDQSNKYFNSQRLHEQKDFHSEVQGNSLNRAMSSRTGKLYKTSNANNDVGGSTPVFPCHLCSKVFASSQFLSQHLELHKKSPRKCNVCDKTFNTGANLKRHMTIHTGEMKYSCPKCSRQFRDPSNFGKHKAKCKSIPESTVVRDNAGSESDPRPNLSEKETSDSLVENTHENDDESKTTNENDNLDDGADELPLVFDYDKPDAASVMTVIPSLEDDNSDTEADVTDTNNSMVDVERTLVGGSGRLKLENMVECEVCHKLCEDDEHLKKHMKYHEGNPDVTCIECGKSFADVFNRNRHMKLHLAVKPFTCRVCGRGYTDNWTLKKHKSKGCLKNELKISQNELRQCEQCFRFFEDDEKLQEHMKSHDHAVKFKYNCDVCGKGFAELFNLKKHRRLHMAICSACGEEFSNLKLLTEHQEKQCEISVSAQDVSVTESVDSDFRCDFCGRSYSTKMYLERHRKIHFKAPSHACDICNKSFSEAFKLKRHKSSAHSNSKPFTCSDCGKSFMDEALLKRHQISSSCALGKVIGEPLETNVCKFCGKTFKKNYMLVRHMAVHNSNRPFTCEQCNKSYKDSSSLKRHQAIHGGVKDFVCPTCGSAFYYADSLKRHMGGRCGNPKSKGRNKSSASSSSKNKKNATDSAINGDGDVMLGRQLNTVPYFVMKVLADAVTKSLFHNRLNKTNRKNPVYSGPWACQQKQHCWLCDTKMPSESDLQNHIQHVHKRQSNSKRFSCRNCFLRFSKKAYWKIHSTTCVSRTLNTILQSKLKENEEISESRRKRTATEAFDADEIVPNFSVWPEDEEMKRPKRSVPRAKWSWISQI